MSKTIKGMIDRIQESNAEYAAADPAKKRVMVCRDVIAAMDAEELIAQSGDYLKADDREADGAARWPLDTAAKSASLQAIIPDLPPCHVCAKGALLMCVVARQNEITVGDLGDRRVVAFSGKRMEAMFGGVFAADQLRLIESAFEGGDVEHENRVDGSDVEIVTERLDGPSPVRLRAIMENIIANGGTFIPAP